MKKPTRSPARAASPLAADDLAHVRGGAFEAYVKTPVETQSPTKGGTAQ